MANCLKNVNNNVFLYRKLKYYFSLPKDSAIVVTFYQLSQNVCKFARKSPQILLDLSLFYFVNIYSDVFMLLLCSFKSVTDKLLWYHHAVSPQILHRVLENSHSHRGIHKGDVSGYVHLL